MSAKRPRLGLNHLTVVPTNFERSDDVGDAGGDPPDSVDD